MTPVQAVAPYDWDAILSLIRSAFAGMEGRIDPPSSMHRLTAQSVSDQAEAGEIWVIADGGPVACVFLTPRNDVLYLGKLAAHPDVRGQGLGLQLLETAAMRARALGRSALELETRVELVENHAYFARHGFAEVGRTAHPGFDRPTSITMRKVL